MNTPNSQPAFNINCVVALGYPLQANVSKKQFDAVRQNRHFEWHGL